MASLSVRKLDDAIYQLLQKRAHNHGVSMEEEVRQIIIQVVMEPEKLSDLFNKHFGAKGGVDLDLRSSKKPHHPMSFDE